MKFQNTKVYNIEGAIRGMRNPKESYHLSDSYFGFDCVCDDKHLEPVINAWMEKSGLTEGTKEYQDIYQQVLCKLQTDGILEYDNNGDSALVAYIGPNDMKLATTLASAGPEHRKYLRQIFVSVDITASIYLWKQLDTYKIGTVSNSTSTMHKLCAKPITEDSFEIDDIDNLPVDDTTSTVGMFKEVINYCEALRQKYLETKDMRYWKELIRILPESYLQKRTITFSYETIHNICSQREHHKLTEWKEFIKWAKTLPYATELIFF